MNRIFLVGNGASLKHTNMDLLIGQPSMALNKIYKLYDQTDWRPTHYVKIDFSAFDPDDWRAEVMPHILNGEQCLLWDVFKAGAEIHDGHYEYIPNGIGEFENVRYIPRCHHHDQRTVGWHHICTGLNSIVPMVIWAVELGFSEIVLVGCDATYNDPRKDHFTPDYFIAVDPDYANRNNTNIKMAHNFLRDNCPIPILDATVNGSLTQYPKVKLEEMCQPS